MIIKIVSEEINWFKKLFALKKYLERNLCLIIIFEYNLKMIFV